MDIKADLFNLKVMIICNDARNEALVKLLHHRVTELYMLKAGRCRKFTPDDPDGLSIPRTQLPTLVNALLFHSSDVKLWEDIQIRASYTFEFNTPGTPQHKENVIPIYRQTFREFAITPDDIEELLAYVSGQPLLPAMCKPLVPLDVLPALSTLCQFYLKEVSQKTTEHKQLAQPEWWLRNLGLLQPQDHHLEPFIYQKLLNHLRLESEMLKKTPKTLDQLDKFINSLVIKQTEFYEVSTQPVTYQTVVDLNNQINVALPAQNSFKEKAEFVDANTHSSTETILAIRGSFAAMVAASVSSQILGVELHILEPEVIEIKDKLPRNSILMLAEFQVARLPVLRLNDFAGAVLVLSADSFSNLKRKHRVLRFGQGSHDALTIPFTLTELLVKVQNLVPMEAENLKFFQKELKAIRQIYQRKVVPCLEKLEQPLTDLDTTAQEISQLLEQMRTDTPVACHTVVTINDEALQIQQHLRKALATLKEQKQANNLAYWKAIFEQWYNLVLSAAGENLKLVS